MSEISNEEIQKLFNGICLRGMCKAGDGVVINYSRHYDCPLLHMEPTRHTPCKDYIAQHPEIHEQLRQYIKDENRALKHE